MEQANIVVDFDKRRIYINDIDVTPIKENDKVNIMVDFVTKKIYINNKEHKMDPKELLSNDGLQLEHINDKTAELCDIAVKQNGAALQYVPPELQTLELCVTALEHSKDNLQYVKNNKEFFEAFLKSRLVSFNK